MFMYVHSKYVSKYIPYVCMYAICMYIDCILIKYIAYKLITLPGN